MAKEKTGMEYTRQRESDHSHEHLQYVELVIQDNHGPWSRTVSLNGTPMKTFCRSYRHPTTDL